MYTSRAAAVARADVGAGDGGAGHASPTTTTVCSCCRWPSPTDLELDTKAESLRMDATAESGNGVFGEVSTPRLTGEVLKLRHTLYRGEPTVRRAPQDRHPWESIRQQPDDGLEALGGFG